MSAKPCGRAGLNRRKKKACVATPHNAKIMGRSANSFPMNPNARKAKLEKNIKSSASERARTSEPQCRDNIIAFCYEDESW